MKKLLVFLLVFSTNIFADAVIFSGNDVKALKANLSLFDIAKILTTATDPSTGGGLVAPIGSIALHTSTGVTYQKTGAGSTAWTGIVPGNYVLKSGDTMTGPLVIDTSIKITKGTSSGANNIYIGAGNRNAGTTGFKNTIIGDFAGDAFAGGADNTVVGYGALQFSLGDANTVFGKEAGRTQFMGSNSVYFGSAAGYSNSSGIRNHAFGDGALYNNLASYNTCFGYQCFVLNTTGQRNLGLGFKAGYNNTTLSDVLYIANTDSGLGSNLITGKFDAGKVGINIDPGSIDANAALQVNSPGNNQYILPPKVTTAQKNAISSPTEGGFLYDTTTHKLSNYDGTSWNDISNGSGTKTFSSINVATYNVLTTDKTKILENIFASATFNLPASPVLDDAYSICTLNADLTISGNGNNIIGESTLSMLGYDCATLQFNGTIWRIL